MLLSDLSRVQAIDKKISQIHGQLAELYSERDAMLRTHETSPKALEKPTHKSPAEVFYETAVMSKKKPRRITWANPITQTTFDLRPTEMYNALQSAWRAHGVELPPYRGSMSTKLRKIRVTAKENKDDYLNLEIVAVPPTKVIRQLLASRPFAADLYATSDSLLALRPSHANWRLFIVGKRLCTLSKPTEAALDACETQLLGTPGDQLGIQEALAAMYQGVLGLPAKGPLLLLRDLKNLSEIPSIESIEGRIVLDTDDTHGLLSTSSVMQAMEIK